MNQYEKRKAKAKAEEKTIEYDRIAYDIFYDDEQRKFVRVTVEYNLLEGVGRVKETKAIADSQPVAIYKMGETINRKILRLPEKLEE